ncbi:hypothetical protein GO755_36140 [Spirosoma sp. HMF4905]|uniref:Glycosyltransferase RgtA/B/C/D-like domain-containing protein n=1 Tax=Spirosoma arboris TaxID=2682092 RepID=A0A7K1SNX4_9BACT|nr:hypothetical protein [Spirosoma arboris]MVM35508.1 hypothetical protein [Spirosoma arboris]
MTRQKKITLLLSITLFVMLAGSLITSLFFKEPWLWMDEVLSYLLISDPSIAHVNEAVVSGMDANPPFFANLYWFIGHTISLNPQFLRAVSIVIFALTIALFYRFTTTLVGTPVTNFVLITAIVSLTYLNITLATQIRAYSVFLLAGLFYFVVLQRLIASPANIKWLIAHCLAGLLLVLTHNFGLFYVAASGAFFAILYLWSRQRAYLLVLATYGLIALGWLLIWYSSFAIQTEAGKPHSWIPIPTFLSFFTTVGELIPTISSALERRPIFLVLPLLRVVLVSVLFIYIALLRLNKNSQAIWDDKALMVYLLAGWIYMATICIALLVSLVHTSVFISRYQWPSHLLLIYQFVYAWSLLRDRWHIPARVSGWNMQLVSVYALLLAGFLFYQNRKVVIFPGGVLQGLSQLDKRYPVFVESAHYFLPIWFHDKSTNVHYVLDWQTAVRPGNMLNASVEHKILEAVRNKYQVSGIMPEKSFNRMVVPHFYVIDEGGIYQIEQFIRSGQVRVIRQLPINLSGHRILECTFRS